MQQLRRRFWAELAMALASGGFLILTLIWRDWIEIVFRVDPDHHNGALEWLIVAAAFAATATFATLARYEWHRRLKPA
jgi:hypothetical protein